MALEIEKLGSFCDRRLLVADDKIPDVYLYDSVQPYQSSGITRQFLENASVYHDRYFQPGHMGDLLANAFLRIGKSIAQLDKVAVLDIGAGSGNSVIPIISGNREVQLVATDLSIDLLRIMAQLIKDRPYQNQIAYVCADANKLTFNTESFDYVIGSSILHHLMNPARALAIALSYLKQGGEAIFFEPFEYGCNILKTIYLLILDDPRSNTDLSPDVCAHFMAMVRDYNARFDTGTVKPYTQYLDDKWLFTKKFFADVCGQHGCEVAVIYSNQVDTNNLFEQQLLCNLKLAGITLDTVPDWVLQIAREIDSTLPAGVKNQLIIDGSVIVRRIAPLNTAALADALVQN